MKWMPEEREEGTVKKGGEKWSGREGVGEEGGKETKKGGWRQKEKHGKN